MESFRKNIVNQVEKMPEGRIFTIKDLDFDISKSANVNVLLSELVKKDKLKRVEKGAYYRYGMSKLGLGPKPIYQEEKIRYITTKIGGYPSGYYMYNQMGLTEQVPAVITIATPNPVREFKFVNLRINCIKAYKEDAKSDEIEYLRVLDAIRQMKHIPGKTSNDIYRGLKNLFFIKYSDKDIRMITRLARFYPPKVRMTIAMLLQDTGHRDISEDVVKSVNPITRNKYSKKERYGTT